MGKGRRTTGRMFKAPSGVYWIEYRHQGKRVRQSLGETKQADAAAKAEAILAPLRLANDRDRRAMAYSAVQSAESELAAAVEAIRPRLAIADTWQAFEADQTRPQSGKRTLKDYGQIWHGFTRWLPENRPGVASIEDVSPAVAESYMAHVEHRGVTGRRFNGIRQGLSLILRTVTRKHTPAESDPFTAVHRKAVETVGHRPLTVEELRAIYGAAQGETRLLVALGMFCGFRLADACLLMWKEVDLSGGKINRTPSKLRSRTNGKAVSVPLHPILVELLSATPPKARKGPVLPETAALYRRAPFAVCNAVRALFESVGIETREEREDGRRAAAVASFHSLRHSLITALARQGTPLHEVRALVGHGSERIQALYLHAAESDVRRAVEALPSPVAALLPAPAVEALRDEVIAAAGTATEDKLRTALAALRG